MKNKETLLDVKGMTCPSCIRHVNAALRDLEGVAKVEVRLRDGRVLVQHHPAVADVGTLIEVLNEAGYQSTESAARR